MQLQGEAAVVASLQMLDEVSLMCVLACDLLLDIAGRLAVELGKSRVVTGIAIARFAQNVDAISKLLTSSLQLLQS